MDWITVTVVLVVIAIAVVLVFTANPAAIVADLVAIVVKAMLPNVLKAVAPKDLTPEQKDRLAEGKDPYNIPKFDHEQWLRMEDLKKKAGWK